jgi:hypothetical protein
MSVFLQTHHRNWYVQADLHVFSNPESYTWFLPTVTRIVLSAHHCKVHIFCFASEVAFRLQLTESKDYRSVQLLLDHPVYTYGVSLASTKASHTAALCTQLVIRALCLWLGLSIGHGAGGTMLLKRILRNYTWQSWVTLCGSGYGPIVGWQRIFVHAP